MTNVHPFPTRRSSYLTSISYSYNSAIASTSATKQYRWRTTAGPGSAAGRTTQSGSFTASANSSVTASLTTQFQLTFAQSGIGGDSTGSVVTISGSVTKTSAQLPFSAFFDSGATVTYTYADPVEERAERQLRRCLDRKSTRLNSSHPSISYAVFCLK